MMKQANINGASIEYEVRGSGEPVVLIHGALIADTYEPMASETALQGYRVIRYRRRGHVGSSRADGPLPISTHSADCLALLRHLDATPAHVVGHSGGGVIAIQVAIDAPEAVRSLSLLEPALIDVPSGAAFFNLLPSIMQAYSSGDKARAVDEFLSAVCGEEYRTVLDAAVPGGHAQAVADADTFFGAEFPAMPSWSFTREDAARITQPVLAVLGEKSDSVAKVKVCGEIQERVLDWFPNARPFLLPNASHFLQAENPHDMAEGLASFFATSQSGSPGVATGLEGARG